MSSSEQELGHEDADGTSGSTTPTVDELVRTTTRLLLGSAALAMASAAWSQRASETAAKSPAATGAGTLASAALGLGLRGQRMLVRSASAAGGAAASVTWTVVHASPFRGPVERLAEQFRTERELSEREVSEAIAAIVDAVSEAILTRVDIDRLIDRIALERVLARMDRQELAERLGRDLPAQE